jgi:hypothetical protein
MFWAEKARFGRREMLNEVEHKELYESQHTDILKERMSRLGQGVMIVGGCLDRTESLREVATAIHEHDCCQAMLSELACELALATEATCDRDTRPLPMVLRHIEIQIDFCTERLYDAWSTLELFHDSPFEFMEKMPNVTNLFGEMRSEATGRRAVLNGSADVEE